MDTIVSTGIRVCGRCHVVLTLDEIGNQRYDDRDRCEACDPMVSSTSQWLSERSIHAVTDDDAHAEWVRRVRVAELTPRVVRDRVNLHGVVPFGPF